jgi:hypothetical protein
MMKRKVPRLYKSAAQTRNLQSLYAVLHSRGARTVGGHLITRPTIIHAALLHLVCIPPLAASHSKMLMSYS